MKWLKNLFKKNKDIQVVGENDEHLVAMVQAAWRQGAVEGHVDENGVLHVKEFKPRKKNEQV